MRLDLSEMSVMVVDDNKFIRLLVVEILRGFNVGYVTEAENGQDALDKLDSAHPDLVLCDWLMQPITGLEFLKQVRDGKTALDRSTPVVMMTGQLDATSVLKARSVGVSGYIAKPVTVDGVMNRLVDVIRQSSVAHHV